MIKESMDLLKICIEKQLICRIERAMIDQNPMFCVPIEMSDSLLAVHFVDDFMYNGVKIIRLNDITRIILGEPEKFLQRVFDDICKPLPKPDTTMKLEDYNSVFTESAGLLVAVECEKRGMRKFLLGIFSGFSNDLVQIHCVSSSGKWDEFYSCVFLSEITCVTLSSRYQKIFSEYIQQQNSDCI